MLNKKDPLIDAIQQVMQSNQADRDAVKAVNEKFGIQDRRVLPHERQGEWDAAYKTVLTEGIAVELVPTAKTQPETSVQGGQGIQGYDKMSKTSSQQPKPQGDNPKVRMEEMSPDQEKLAAVGKKVNSKNNPKKIDAEDLEGARMGHASHIKEAEKMKGEDPCWDTHKMVGMKKGKGGKPVPNCVPVSEEGDPSKAIPGDTVTGGSSVTPVTKPKPRPTSITPEQQNALTNKIKSIKEAKKAAMCESNNEGFNNRRDLSVTASAGKQVVADQLNEDDIDSYENRMTAGLGGFNPYGGGRFGGGTAKKSGSGTDLTRVKASNINTRTGEPFKRTPKPTKKYANAADELSPAAKARFRKTLDAKMKAGGVSGNVLKKPVAKAKAGKAAQPAPQSSSQPGTQPGFDASGNRVYNNAFTKIINDANAKKARVKAVSRPAKKVDSAQAASSKLRTPSGTFAANLQKARDQAQGNRVAVNTSTATQAKPAATAATQAKPTVAAQSKPGSGLGLTRSALSGIAAGGAATAAYMYGNQDNAPATAVAKPKSKGEGELGAGAYDRVPQNSGVMSMPNIRPTTALAAPAKTGSGTSQAAAKAPTSYTAQKGDTVWGMAKKDIQSKRAQAVASVPDAGQGEISRARATGVSNRDTLSRTNELLKSNQMTDQSARKMQIGKVVKTD